MAKIQWRFVNESGTNLNRYIATNVATGETITFDLLRGGTINVVGTPLDATYLNELIEAINAAYDQIVSNEKNTTYTLTRVGDIVTLTDSDGKTNTFSLSDKLDKAQGSSQANKIVMTDANGNITFLEKIPSSNLPQTGVSVDTAKNIESSSGTIISGQQVEQNISDVNNLKENVTNIENSLEEIKNEVNEDLTATIECVHRYEITGDTGNEHGLAITDQQALIPKIQGRTLTKNQLMNLALYDNTITTNGVTFTKGINGSVIANGEATSNSVPYGNRNINIIKNHKYCLLGCPKGGSTNTYKIMCSPASITPNTEDIGNGAIFTALENDVVYVSPLIIQGTTVNNLTFIPQLIDLTLAYCAGNEPTTVEEVLNDFPEYIPYIEGEFVHSNNTLVSTGRNIFNYTGSALFDYNLQSNFKDGKITLTSTAGVDSTKYSLIPIKLLPNKTYYLNFNVTQGELYNIIVWYKDSSGNDLGSSDGVQIKGTLLLSSVNISKQFTTNENTEYYITFYQSNETETATTLVIEDFIISNQENPTYKPYEEDVISGIGELQKFDYIDNETGEKTYESIIYTIKDNSTIGYNISDDYKSFYIIGAGEIFRNVGIDFTNEYLTTSSYIENVYKNESNDLIIITNKEYLTIDEFKADMVGVQILGKALTSTYAEINLPAGYAVAKGGMQIQQGTIPYNLTKEYSLNLKAQVLNNIEIDKEQQEQIDIIKSENKSFQERLHQAETNIGNLEDYNDVLDEEIGNINTILSSAGIDGNDKVVKVISGIDAINFYELFDYLEKNNQLIYSFNESNYNAYIVDWQVFNTWIGSLKENTIYVMLEDNFGADHSLVYINSVKYYTNTMYANIIVIPTYDSYLPTTIGINGDFSSNEFKISILNDTYFNNRNIPQFVSLTAYLDFPTTGNSMTFDSKDSFVEYCEDEQLYNYIFEQHKKVKVIGIMQDGQDSNGQDVLIQLGNAYNDTQGALTITYEFVSISHSIIVNLFFKLNTDGSITIEYSGDLDTYRLVRKMDLKTINNQSLYGAGNIVIEGGSGSSSSVSVENNLTSTSTTNALSAYQGKVLNEKINQVQNAVNTNVNEIDNLREYVDEQLANIESGSGSGSSSSDVATALLWSGNTLSQGLSAIALPTNYEKYKMLVFELDMVSNDGQLTPYGTITISVPFIDAESSTAGYYSFYDFYTTRLFSAKVNLLGNGYYNLTLNNMYVYVKKIYGIG